MAKDKKSNSIKKKKKKNDKQVIFLTNEKLLTKYNLSLKSPDEILEHEGLDYYDKMLSTDAHVYSVVQTRKMGAASYPYTIISKNDTPEAIKQKEFIVFLLNEIDIENHFFDILDAIPKGFAIHEITTKQITSNDEFQDKIIIDSLIFHSQKFFTFKAKPETGYDIFYKSESFGKEEPIPLESILHSIFDSHSPYGKPLLEKLYWYYWFKKETGFKFWAIFLEKFGGPTSIMTYPSGDTSGTLQDQALRAVEDLQNETGIVIPDNFKLEFAKVSQGDISFQDMIDACNAEMSKAALGATQTVEEGRRGSYALSRTHTDVRSEYKYFDTNILRKPIQKQIINRFINLNFINPLPPTIKFISSEEKVEKSEVFNPDHKPQNANNSSFDTPEIKQNSFSSNNRLK